MEEKIQTIQTFHIRSFYWSKKLILPQKIVKKILKAKISWKFFFRGCGDRIKLWGREEERKKEREIAEEKKKSNTKQSNADYVAGTSEVNLVPVNSTELVRGQPSESKRKPK